MKIHVGSANEVKIQAVREICQLYPSLKDAEVAGYETQSGVSKQPMTMMETIKGAKRRATTALFGADLGIGIESGLMTVPFTNTGYMDFCAVVVMNGKREMRMGLSPAFECPKAVIDLVLKERLDLNEAFLRTGLTRNPKLGNSDGAVGMLTGGRITRKEYTKQALIMALISLDIP